MGYGIRTNRGDYLEHSSHKYIDRVWKNGHWNYIYEEAKNKLGVGTKDKAANARDESRRANYEARKANEDLATATANRQYALKRLGPDGQNMGKYAYARTAEANAKANARQADRNAASKKRAADHADYVHENSLANKASQTVEKAKSSVSNFLKSSISSIKDAANEGKKMLNSFLTDTVGIGAKERYESAKHQSAEVKKRMDANARNANDAYRNGNKPLLRQIANQGVNQLYDADVQAYRREQKAAKTYNNSWAGKVDNTLKKAKKRFGF